MKKLISLILLTFFFLNLATAFDFNNPTSLDFKWQLCSSANMTGKNCDLYWISFKQAMGIEEEKTNETYVDQQFNNYYNRTEIDKRLNNIVRQNFSEQNNSEFITIEEFVNKTHRLRSDILGEGSESLVDRQYLRDFYGDPKSSASDSDNDLFLIMGFIVLAVLAFIGYNYITKKQGLQPRAETYQPPIHRRQEKRIKSTGEMEEEQETAEENKTYRDFVKEKRKQGLSMKEIGKLWKAR